MQLNMMLKGWTQDKFLRMMFTIPEMQTTSTQRVTPISHGFRIHPPAKAAGRHPLIYRAPAHRLRHLGVVVVDIVLVEHPGAAHPRTKKNLSWATLKHFLPIAEDSLKHSHGPRRSCGSGQIRRTMRRKRPKPPNGVRVYLRPPAGST